MSLFASPSSAAPGIRFVSIGECMVEMAPSDQPGQFKMGFAGDTFNTAWYVKTLAPDWETRFVTRVGTDDVSDRMLAMMTDARIDTNHIQRSQDRSAGLYLISVTDGERSFSYWRSHSAARQLADDETALTQATDDADVVYFSGITMAILDAAGRARLLGTARKARTAGKTVVFDSNLRPRLWTNPDEMTQTVMQAAAVSDIVLPSYDDEAAYFGDADIIATRDRYLEAGASIVVVKDGAGEIHYSKDRQTGCVKPPAATQIVDTTSAGDSFNAGFLVGLAQSGSMQDAIRLAAQVAGQVIAQKGALVPLSTTS